MTCAHRSLDEEGGVMTATSMSAPEAAMTTLRVRKAVRRWHTITTAKAASATTSSGSCTGALATAPKGMASAVVPTARTSARRPTAGRSSVAWARAAMVLGVPAFMSTGNVPGPRRSVSAVRGRTSRAQMNFLDPTHLINTYGIWGIFAIIFAESGLFFGFFLPGDSLLVTAGLLAATHKAGDVHLNLASLLIGIPIAAIPGHQARYR